MRSINRILISCCLATAFADAAVTVFAAGGGKPATATSEAAAPAPVAASFATPMDALKSFLRAQAGTDAGAIRDTLIIPTERKQDVDAVIAFMTASNELQIAAIKKFGAAGSKLFGTGPVSQLSARIKAIEGADVKVAGDKATIQVAANPEAGQVEATITLLKSDAGWKIDAVTLFTLDAAAANSAERIEQSKRLTAIARQVTDGIKAGKYASAADANQAYWLPVAEALKAATKPATEPAATLPVPATMQMK